MVKLSSYSRTKISQGDNGGCCVGRARVVAAVRGGAGGAALGGERGAGRGLAGARRRRVPRPVRGRPGARHLALALRQVSNTIFLKLNFFSM